MNNPAWEDQKHVPIGYDCYDHGHYSVDWRKSIAHFAEMFPNYASLNANDKARVTDKNYILEYQLTRLESATPPDTKD